MAGKRGLIMGVANEALDRLGHRPGAARAGAEMAFTYQGGRSASASSRWSRSSAPRSSRKADVENEASLDRLFDG
jgi:enoyl-[acyl-carrier-protein] reductase (NADH)